MLAFTLLTWLAAVSVYAAPPPERAAQLFEGLGHSIHGPNEASLSLELGLAPPEQLHSAPVPQPPFWRYSVHGPNEAIPSLELSLAPPEQLHAPIVSQPPVRGPQADVSATWDFVSGTARYHPVTITPTANFHHPMLPPVSEAQPSQATADTSTSPAVTKAIPFFQRQESSASSQLPSHEGRVQPRTHNEEAQFSQSLVPVSDTMLQYDDLVKAWKLPKMFVHIPSEWFDKLYRSWAANHQKGRPWTGPIQSQLSPQDVKNMHFRKVLREQAVLHRVRIHAPPDWEGNEILIRHFRGNNLEHGGKRSEQAAVWRLSHGGTQLVLIGLYHAPTSFFRATLRRLPGLRKFRVYRPFPKSDSVYLADNRTPPPTQVLQPAQDDLK